MAEGFDNAKASTDLKHILKMNQGPQEVSTDSKNKRKNKKTEDTKKSDDGYGTQSSQQRKYGRSKNTHTNSNGNALLDSATDPRSPDFTQSVPRSIANSNLDQSVQKMTKKNKEQGSSSQSENRSISAPMVKKYSENIEPFEVVNSNKRGFKNRKHLAESEFVRNPKDSTSGRKESNSSYNRNSSSDKDQRRNYESLRNGDQETSNFGKNREPYRSLSRGDKNHPQMNEGRSQMEKASEMRNNSDNSSKPHSSEPEEEELSAELLLTLEENSIMVLKKKNLRFVKAKYYCELCDFHLNTKADCDKHMKEYRHSRKKKLNDVDVILKRIPEPDEHQVTALTAAVDKVFKKHGISEKEKKQRADVVIRLEKMLQKNVPDVLIFMYGSSLTGFGMKTADINVNLTSAEKDKKLTLLLKETYKSLNDLTGSGFSNLRSDFTAKIPGFFVLDDVTDLTVHVIIHCYNAHCSSELLSIYSDFDIRIRKLCVAFRYWAHLCGLDQKCDGFIAPQALNLMVIYFLQVINPQLVPLIQPPKVTGDEIGDYRKDAPGFEKMRSKVMKVCMDGSNKMSVGELWLRLLQFYSLEFDTPNVVVCIHSNQIVPRTSKPWNSKKLAVEDPYMLKRNITRMVSNSRIYEYWEDSIRKAFHYFGFPRNAEGKSYISIESVMKEADDESSREESKSGSHSESEDEDDDSSEGDDGRDFCDVVEQPSSASCGTQNKPSTFVQSDLSDAPNDSSTSQRMGGNATSSSATIEKDRPVVCTCKNNETDDVKSGKTCLYCAQSSTKPISGQKEVLDKQLGNNEDALATDGKRLSQSSSCSSEEKDTRNNVELPEEKSSAFVPSAERDYHYEFSKDFLTDGKGPVLVCTYCEAEGHLKNACPEDKLPEVLSLPPLTPLHVRILSETLNKVQSRVGLNAYDLGERVNFMQKLEHFIQGQFKDANLALFGSTCNGFGFANSDMDICLTFSYRKVIDKPWLVESLARKLKQCTELFNVQAIPTAKVPIVKFFVKSIRLDGDISFYNILAQHNTKLLLRYSQIDHRVQILGYAIKNFAKVCDIGDASRGSLSSYAYILMMIYYLQQVTPPVIPVLQQLHEGKEKPRLIIEGCDAWFMEDLNKLDKLWPEKGRNKMSIAELWLGFLRFYVEDFNYKELVVSIRQREPLTRFEKFWNGENIAVEDPFDVSHNLGSGLSRKMNNFIFKTFINGRMLYGSPIDDNMDMFKSYTYPYDYFFDTDLLSENRPPNIRGCRQCGKMGHLAKRCPAAQKEKVEQKGLQKQQKQPQQQPLLQQPLQQGQAHAAQQQKMPALLQDPREQQKQPARSHQQNQAVQGSQQQKQQPQQQNQPYQQAQQYKQDSQKQQLAQPSQSQQQKQLFQQQNEPETSQQQQSQPSNQSQENQLSLSQQQRQPLLQKPLLSLFQQKQLPQHQLDRINPQQNDGPLQQQHERRQPSQHEERTQSTHQDERRQPSRLEEQRQPSQYQRREPSQQEERRQLSQQEERRQPSQHEDRRQPSQQEDRRLPSQQEDRRLPSQQEDRRLPSQQEDRRLPSQQEDRRLPSQQEDRRLPSQQEDHSRLPSQQEDRSRQPSQHEDRRLPSQQEDHRRPSQQEDRSRQPSQQEDRRQPSQQEDRRLPSQQEDHRRPSQHEDRRLPSQQEDRRRPSQQEDRRRPSQQEERSQPPQFEERRQPPHHEKHGQPLQQEERRQVSHHEEYRQPKQQVERTQHPQQVERTQHPQQVERTQPPQQEQRQPPPLQEKQTQSLELEQLSQKEKQQTQSFQSQHQSSSQPQQDSKQHFQQTTRQPDQWHHSQSPQRQQQLSHSPQPQQPFSKPHQQLTQQHPHQPLQKNSQPFQQQRQTPQLQQQTPPLLHQQWQHPKQHQPSEREFRDSRDEHHWQKGLTGNMNVNSSGPGFPYNFIDPRSVQAGVPTIMSDVPSQVYHNSSYIQRNIHHQQHMPGGYRHNNSAVSSLGSLPPPLPTFPRFNAGPFSQRLPPSLMSNMPYPPGFHQPPHGLNSGFILTNYDGRGPHNAPGFHYSGQGSRGNNNAGEQLMNPIVQNIFDSAGGKVLNDSSGRYYRPT